jgi:transcriptional regulator with XRE-family HTH domain
MAERGSLDVMPAGSTNELGAFLRAHRARVEPADVGLPGGGDRRVAGLRREEVAVLAGVSVDYYTRLEQGRERNPSAQVLDAIGRALELHPDARGHVFRLAGLNPGLAPYGSRDRVHPALLELLDAFPHAAAYVLSPAFDVLATNAIAAALLSPFSGMTNMVRVLFQHPQARVVFVEWPILMENVVHALRLNAGRFPYDPEIRALVDELSRISPEFRALWQDQDVRGLTRMFKVFVHPDVGRVELTYQTFDVRDAPGQQLLVGTPEPGGRSAEAIAYLGSMNATA